MNHPLRRSTAIILLILVTCFFGVFSQAPAQAECAGGLIFISKACVGDGNSADEKALFELVNGYRIASKLSPLRLSSSLSIVANRRMLDLKQNLKMLTHSWSDCKYDIQDPKTFHCVTNAPRRLKCGYMGDGYETLYRTASGKAVPAMALAEWKKSTLHNSIILNDGPFKPMPWDEVGVAIDGEYAALWFGYLGDESRVGPTLSYSRAIAGLSNVFSVKQSGGRDLASTGDNRVILALTGPNKDVDEVVLKLEPDGMLATQTRSTASSVLKNLFPEWPDIDGWLDRGTAAVSENQTATRTKIVRKISIEMRSGGPDTLRLLIRAYGPKTTSEAL